MILVSGDDLVKPSKEEVEKFLSDVKFAIANHNYVARTPREFARDIQELGLSLSDAKERICNLTYKDYFQGPERNDQYYYDDYLWMFKKVIGTHMAYIKLQIRYKGRKGLVIWSFHIDRPD